MKKNFFLSLLVVTLSFQFVTAQSDFDAENLRFGIQFSPSFSWISTNTNRINPSGTNLGMKLGMIAEYNFGSDNRYAFSTGLGFAFNSGGTLLHEFGGSYWNRADLGPSLDTLPNGTKLKYGIQYLEIPAGLKMKFQPATSRDISFFVEPGIVIGFKTQARGEITASGVPVQDEKINIRREVNGINLSWGIGAGLEFQLSGNMSMVGGLGFQSGFTDITDDNGRVINDPRNPDGRRENSKGTVNNIVVKLGLMF